MTRQRPDDRYDVFISYAQEDLPTVGPDVAWLKQQQYDVWFDTHVSADRQSADELAEAIDACGFVLFFTSAHSVRSAHCLNEIAYATDADKAIIPVYLEQTEVSGGLKLSISRAQAILRWQLSREEYRQRLQHACTSLREAYRSIELSAPRPRASIWLVPAIQNRAFCGREALFDRIARHLHSDSPAAVALSGMAGVGKSQIALEYAYRHRREYGLVAWIRAETAAALETDLVALAAALGLDHADDPSTDVVLAAVGRHLSGLAGALLIFDNIENSIDLRRYLPTDFEGHVILTTRQQQRGRYARNVRVDTFSTAEALSFLEHRLQPDDPSDLLELVDALGRLPLALEEAAAYIEATGRSVASYLSLFANHRRILLDRVHEASDYPTTLRAALEVSLEQLEAEDPAAAGLLGLLSVVAPEDINVAVLVDSEIERLAAADGEASTALPAELLADRCIAVLGKYSLIRVIDGRATVHRLVQLVCRDRLPREARLSVCCRALERLESAFPKVRLMGERSADCRRLLPHALALFGRFEQDAKPPKALGILMTRVGTFMSGSSWSRASLGLLEQAYRILHDAHDDPMALAYTSALYGWSCYKHGELESAEALLLEALEIYERTPPVMYKRTMLIHIDLAWVAWSQADYARAEQCARQSLDATAQAFGRHDPRRMAALSILARVCMDAGRVDDARAAVNESIRAIESVRGYRSIVMCGVFMQIAQVLLSLGDLVRAQSWASEAIALGGPALSESHPLIGISHCILGQVHSLRGDHELALTELEMAAAGARESEAPLNQYEVIAFCHLARTLLALGRVERAGTIAGTDLQDLSRRIAGSAAYAEALAALVRAEVACRQGRTDAALELAVEGDRGICEHFGAGHLYRLDALLTLGGICREAGQDDRAREYHETGIAICREQKLPGHPRLAELMLGLASPAREQEKGA